MRLLVPTEPVDLAGLLTPGAPPFAVLYRPGETPGQVDVITGDVCFPDTLDRLPRGNEPGYHVLALVPYGQIKERGFARPDDDAKLIGLAIRDHRSVPLRAVLKQLPTAPIKMSTGGFDLDDDRYAALVRQLVANEIGQGEGSNFVLRRSFAAQLHEWSPAVAGSLFARLLEQESGAYWTFLIHTGDLTFIGASPERQITLADGQAAMNPISGTYRYPASGPDLDGALAFLGDQKESDELYMVVDEELKMMAGICPDGDIRVVGPLLKQMAHVAHTEYYIEGRSTFDAREVLGRSLPAPTIVGSPLESACRIVSRYESSGRGYYGGAVALIGADGNGRSMMDSAILIRCAQVDAMGRLAIGVGATVVRDSNPEAEAAETKAKAAGLLRALSEPLRAASQVAPVVQLAADPRIEQALTDRNAYLSPFWFSGKDIQAFRGPLSGMRILVIDAEDSFTAMLAYQIRSLGATVTVVRYDVAATDEPYDLTVLGPGPGDPRDRVHPKIAALRAWAAWLIGTRRPFLAVCLGHQVLSDLLGLSLIRRDRPNQGTQRVIDLFGQRVRVGFYNSYSACSEADEVWLDGLTGPVRVSRDELTDEVHALIGPHFRSFQFHPESLLSQDGLTVLREALLALRPVGVNWR